MNQEKNSSQSAAPELSRIAASLWLAVLVIIAFLLRFRVGYYQQPSFDGCGYIMHAWSIAQGKLTTIYWAKGIDHYYQPLYPLVIVLFHKISSDWSRAAFLANHFLGALLLVPFYLFGKKIYGRTGGIFCAALLTTYPALLELGSNPASEPAFLLGFGFGIYCLQLLIEDRRFRQAILTGLCFGLSYLARSQALVFLPITLLFMLWLVFRKKLRLAPALKAFALLLVSFYVFALPYDLYCIRKDGSYGLRARQEFFKKVAEPQTMAYYLAERELDRDAQMLVNFRKARNFTPLSFVASAPREYLAQAELEFRHSANAMLAEGYIINTLIALLLLLALLAVILKKTPAQEIKKLGAYLIWVFFFALLPPLTAPAPFRYYVGLCPLLALFAAGGVIFMRTACAQKKSLRRLASRPALLFWTFLLLVLFPPARFLYLGSSSEMDKKFGNDLKVAEFLKKHLPGQEKIIMSNNPLPALLTHNHWLLFPLDFPMRTISYAQTQEADYLLAEEYPFAWVELPPDWSDYFTTPFSKPGLKFIASLPEGDPYPTAVLYQVETPRLLPSRLPDLIWVISDSPLPGLDALNAKAVSFPGMTAASLSPECNLASMLFSLALEKALLKLSPKEKAVLELKSLPGLLEKYHYQSLIFSLDPALESALSLGSQIPGLKIQKTFDPAAVLKSIEQKNTDRPAFILLRADNSFCGKLLDRLRQKNLLTENTLLLLNSELAVSRPGLLLKNMEEPLLMAWPGHLPGGQTSSGQCRTIDILPTLFDLLDLPVPPQAEGVSLRPLIFEKNDLNIAALSEHQITASEFSQALRAAGWLYYQLPGQAMLFNLMSDPDAKVNLLAPAVINSLSDEKWRELEAKSDTLKTALDNWNAFNQKHLQKCISPTP